MRSRKFAFVAAALLAAAPLAAETHVEPAVQPGGDIPPTFIRHVPPIPKGGDIPQRFTPPRADFQYVRREVMIPMRDGVKLYAVLIIPKGTRAQIPDHARPHALFGGQVDRRAIRSDRCRRTSFRRCPPSWCAPATSSPSRTYAGNTNPAAIMS